MHAAALHISGCIPTGHWPRDRQHDCRRSQRAQGHEQDLVERARFLEPLNGTLEHIVGAPRHGHRAKPHQKIDD